jgi:hypothetical protein
VAFRPDHAGIVNALTYDMALTPALATRVEKRRPLSGDRIVPERMFAVAQAITIDAPIERGWPCLIRTIKLLFLAGILVSGSWSEANAQTSASDRWYVNVSSGGSPQDQTFSESATFDIYGQQGALDSAYSIGGGKLFDVSAGMRVWKSLGVGIGYSANKNKHDATVSVRVPHPLVFGQSREASVTASDLEHTEKIVHLQFVWMLPLTSKLQLMFMGGPSLFTVRQNLATVRAPQDVRDEAPFTSVTITNVTVTDVKDSPVGVNVGVDGTYEITRIAGLGIGVGGFVRYVGASVDFPTLTGATREKVLAGGHQWGIGLRVRFW